MSRPGPMSLSSFSLTPVVLSRRDLIRGTVLLALADGACFLEHVNRPSAHRPIAGLRSLVISMEMAPERRIVLSVIRSGR